jgi:phasin family protein
MATTTKKRADTASKSTTDMPVFDGLAKLIEQLRLPGIDAGAVIEWQRKDFEALAEANRQAYEGVQALAQRRNEILRESIAQLQEALKDAAGNQTLAKQAEAAKRGIQQAIDRVRELSEMEAQARNNAWKVVQDRMQENMANLQSLLQPK